MKISVNNWVWIHLQDEKIRKFSGTNHIVQFFKVFSEQAGRKIDQYENTSPLPTLTPLHFRYNIC